MQTPVRGRAADGLRIGDRVLVRLAKAGETLERFDTVHLVRSADGSGGPPRIEGSVATYRGEGGNFG